jgi:pyruvate formate lyase activating enzyme
VDTCPALVFSKVGKQIPIMDLVENLTSNKIFYDNSKGGVTLTGGEPLLFPKYVLKLVTALEKQKINTIIETCGFFDLDEIVLQILKSVSGIYFDIKLVDNSLHKQYCGIENQKILENFSDLINRNLVTIPNSIKDLQLLDSGPFLIPRIPLIPDITTTHGNLMNIVEILNQNRIKVIDLLPYNPLWLNKMNSLGLDSEYTFDKWQTKEELQRVYSYFTEFEIETLKI